MTLYVLGGIEMKSTGIVRKVDELGRVVIPIELRRTLTIGEKDALEIFTEGETIILKKYEPACIFCGQAKGVKNVKGKNIFPNYLIHFQHFLFYFLITKLSRK